MLMREILKVLAYEEKMKQTFVDQLELSHRFSRLRIGDAERHLYRNAGFDRARLQLHVDAILLWVGKTRQEFHATFRAPVRFRGTDVRVHRTHEQDWLVLLC